jgi:hypothetical protein
MDITSFGRNLRRAYSIPPGTSIEIVEDSARSCISSQRPRVKTARWKSELSRSSRRWESSCETAEEVVAPPSKPVRYISAQLQQPDQQETAIGVVRPKNIDEDLLLSDDGSEDETRFSYDEKMETKCPSFPPDHCFSAKSCPQQIYTSQTHGIVLSDECIP